MAAIPRCVLVDDDPDFVTFVRVCLWRVCPRLEIITFANGAEAIGYLEKNAADLLITDNKLPMVDGLKLTRDVRAMARHRKLPIVVMSGDRIEAEALAHGADVFLSKSDLGPRLASLLARFGIKSNGAHSAAGDAVKFRDR